MIRIVSSARLAALLATAVASAQDPTPAPVARPAPSAAAVQELAKATAKAKVHNKRVLAVFSAPDSDALVAMKRTRELSRPLLYEFETVALAGADAEAMAVAWKFPDAMQARPALCVLDADGKVLAREVVTDLFEDDKAKGAPLLAKLKPLFCEPVDAEAKLKSAQAEAKKSGRAVFVRFDAPW